MVYVFGTVGFVAGFFIGLFVISMFLKGYTKEDLVQNKSLRWTYGFAVWIFAALGTYIGVWLYDRSF